MFDLSEPVGPDINPAECPSSAVYNQWLVSESYSKEPVPAPEPESITLTPPNLTAGVSVLSCIKASPIILAEPVTDSI